MPLTVMGESGAPKSDPEALWLLEALDNWRVHAEATGHRDSYTVTREFGPRIRPTWFSASQLGKPDDILIAEYRGYYVPESKTAREYRIWDNGTDRDADFKADMLAAGLSMVDDDAREIVIPWLRLRGSMDDMAPHPETFEPWIVEFKTANAFSYGRLTEPMSQHRLQVHAYMAGTTARKAAIVYESKNDQARRAFYVPWDEEIWQGIVQRLQQLRRDAEALDAAMDPAVLQASRQLAQELAGEGLRVV